MSIKSDYELLQSYVLKNINSLLKEKRGYIKYPFIDPGSVYDGNVWDWDTYWSVYALLPLLDNLDAKLKEKAIEAAKGNVFNFLDFQLEDGYIPMMVEYKGEAEPYLNAKHKQGYIMNMHKPFLCKQILLISNYINDISWVLNNLNLEKLEKYFSCYDKYYLNTNLDLYIWADDVMIGVDNDPSTFGRPRFSTASVYLNSFLVGEFKAFATLLKKAGFQERASYYNQKAEELGKAIRTTMFDKRDGFFYSIDVDIKTRSFDWFHKGLGAFWGFLPIKVQSWSSFIPLYEGIATKEMAKQMVDRYHENDSFSCPFGVTTLSQDERMFNLEPTNNPSSWLGGVWLVANYVVAKGFDCYGYKEEARIIALKSLQLLATDLKKTGSLHEYYNPFTGEPIMNGGFLNWNILVLNLLSELKLIE